MDTDDVHFFILANEFEMEFLGNKISNVWRRQAPILQWGYAERLRF